MKLPKGNRKKRSWDNYTWSDPKDGVSTRSFRPKAQAKAAASPKAVPAASPKARVSTSGPKKKATVAKPRANPHTRNNPTKAAPMPNESSSVKARPKKKASMTKKDPMIVRARPKPIQPNSGDSPKGPSRGKRGRFTLN